MKITCERHPDHEVNGSYCSRCGDEQAESLTKQGVVNVTGSFGYITSVVVDGKPAIAQHPYEYMEYAVPSILLKRLEGIVESEIARFQKSCECVSCILERERKEKE